MSISYLMKLKTDSAAIEPAAAHKTVLVISRMGPDTHKTNLMATPSKSSEDKKMIQLPF